MTVRKRRPAAPPRVLRSPQRAQRAPTRQGRPLGFFMPLRSSRWAHTSFILYLYCIAVAWHVN